MHDQRSPVRPARSIGILINDFSNGNDFVAKLGIGSVAELKARRSASKSASSAIFYSRPSRMPVSPRRT